MKRMFVTIALALLTLPAAAQTVQQAVSGGQGQISAEQLVKVEAMVQSIDLSTREVGLKTEKGEEFAVTAGPEVRRLADLKVGDKVTMEYYESLTLALSKVEGEAPSLSQTDGELRSEPTELPGGIKTRQTTLVAKVTAVDIAASTVTLVGPKGRSVTLDVDPAIAAKLKAGDAVNATYTEALAVSVTRVTSD